MRNREGGFCQNQARFRIGQRHAPSHRLPGQGVVIDVRIVSAKSELEAVLAGERSVARAGIAAHFGEDGNHVVSEAPRRLLGE